MASIDDKAVRLATAQQKVEALIKAARADLRSPRAFGVGSELINACADIAKEFGFAIKTIYPARTRRT